MLDQRSRTEKDAGAAAGKYWNARLFLRADKAGELLLGCLLWPASVVKMGQNLQWWTENMSAMMDERGKKRFTRVCVCVAEVPCIILRCSPHILAIMVRPRSSAAMRLCWTHSCELHFPSLAVSISFNWRWTKMNSSFFVLVFLCTAAVFGFTRSHKSKTFWMVYLFVII